MKKLILPTISILLLSACTQVIASNDKQITIQAPPALASKAFQQADMHCKGFNKSAVPSGTMYGTVTVFKCE